ncbi:hypothetical protein [Paenibacillus humicus]|uniref:hypothetical protein n=1 Tax=Paenibacillus humicus TaxID=412861 RepID=UPI000FDBC0E6|nr:hypothetical protein [Paenibacillus humicus]
MEKSNFLISVGTSEATISCIHDGSVFVKLYSPYSGSEMINVVRDVEKIAQSLGYTPYETNQGFDAIFSLPQNPHYYNLKTRLYCRLQNMGGKDNLVDFDSQEDIRKYAEDMLGKYSYPAMTDTHYIQPIGDGVFRVTQLKDGYARRVSSLETALDYAGFEEREWTEESEEAPAI